MKLNNFLVLTIIIFFVSCAKKGRPTGGKKDETAPLLVSAKPPYESKNFKDKKIKIYFDEYIILRDLDKQLIVSPPLKNRPIITPQGTASKTITIKFTEDLQPNTTYTFNFGNAIQDNNEGNKLESFKYVFSTGNEIDSLQLKGKVIDALDGKLKSNCSLLLYKLDSTYNDSIVFKQKPNYVAITTDSLNFNFSNVKEGKYKLFALQEDIKDYIFSPKTDKIGFHEQIISLPKDSVLKNTISIFKETQPFRLKRAKEVSKGKIQFPFIGKQTDLNVKLLSNVPSDFKEFTQFEKDKDTLNYWFSPIKKDSLDFIVKNEKFIDTLTIRLNKKKLDSISISSSVTGILHLSDTIFIESNNPIVKLDKSRFSMIKDSAKIDFNIIEKNKLKMAVLFERTPKSKYKLDILPKAFTDIYNLTNNTLSYNFTTKSLEEYGSISLNLDNKTKQNLILELIENKKVIQKRFVSSETKKVTFKFLEPKKYKIRAIIDKNKNKIWDTGNYLEKIQPEKIVYFDKELTLRANWNIEENFVIE